MGYPARTFYKCVRFDYRDLHRGLIDFQPFIGREPFVLTTPLSWQAELPGAKPAICSSDVIHASPKAHMAAHYASHVQRFAHSRPDPRLRMLECFGRPVTHETHGVPKYGFRTLELVRVVPPAEVFALLIAGTYAQRNYWIYPERVPGEAYAEQIREFCKIYFPLNGHLPHEWRRRPRLPQPLR